MKRSGAYASALVLFVLCTVVFEVCNCWLPGKFRTPAGSKTDFGLNLTINDANPTATPDGFEVQEITTETSTTFEAIFLDPDDNRYDLQAALGLSPEALEVHPKQTGIEEPT